jgi:rsbT co-antagonist protein RsbR
MEIEDDELKTTVLERIADILLTVAAVGAGDYSTRLQSDLEPEHPMSTLYEGINQMVASLAEEQQRSTDYRKQLEEKIAMIEVQRAAIRELSTPVIEVWDGVLCLPIVGVMDTARSAEMTETLLRSIVEKKATCAIIDLTGIQVLDTATADHFLRMAKAVRLLGAECMLTGINPNIAQTIVHMGIELRGVGLQRSLRSALQRYVGRATDSINGSSGPYDAT